MGLAQNTFDGLMASLQATGLQNSYGGTLGGLGNAFASPYQNTFTTANSSSQIVYLNQFNPVAEIAPPAVVPDDEVTWLRKRVDEVCWRKAA